MRDLLRRLVPEAGKSARRRASALAGRLRRRLAIARACSHSNCIRIVLGAGLTDDPGWIATDQDALDVCRYRDFRNLMHPGTADAFLAEHLFEHLTPEAAVEAFRNCYRFLAPGGRLRIAVPDGNRRDGAYVREVEPPKDGHRQLYTVDSLSEQLTTVGFKVQPLEWVDGNGTFHFRDWSPADGRIRRSIRFDAQDAFRTEMLVVAEEAPDPGRESQSPPLSRGRAAWGGTDRHGHRSMEVRYTSLIVDAVKPGRKPAAPSFPVRRDRGRGTVLIVGNPDGKLFIERSRIPAEAGFRVCWFYWRAPATVRLQEADWVRRFVAPPPLGRSSRIVTPTTLYSMFLALQPCVVHVHYPLCTWPQARMLARLHPLVASVMGGDIMPDQGFKDPVADSTRYLLEHADVITSKSRFMDNRLAEIGDLGRKIRRISWGMDVQQFRPGIDEGALRKRYRLHDDDVVLFCARVCEKRTNKEMVVRAFARALTRFKRPARLLISEYLGDEAYCAHLHDVVSKLGIDAHVRFAGEIPTVDMPAAYNLADATISVALSDGMPQTVYQAASCGSYLLLSDIRETRELTEAGISASVVGTQDTAALAKAMVWVVNNREEARKQGAANRDVILPLADKETQDANMVAIYEELMKRTTGGARLF